jgi:hypothetical protein
MPSNIPLRYRVDLETLVVDNLPPRKRKPVWKAYLLALLKPVAECYSTFTAFVATTRRELAYNGQTLNFQRALNDLFDPVLARIRIINSDASFNAVYINFVAEQEDDKYIKFASEPPPHLMIYSGAEYANQVGFIVRCPASLRPKEAALRAKISQYKLALVNYRIQYV